MSDLKTVIHFRPVHPDTLTTLAEAFERAGEDASACYSLLLSATAMAGAMLTIEPNEAAAYFPAILRLAEKAIHDHPEIFDAAWRDQTAPADMRKKH